MNKPTMNPKTAISLDALKLHLVSGMFFAYGLASAFESQLAAFIPFGVALSLAGLAIIVETRA